MRACVSCLARDEDRFEHGDSVCRQSWTDQCCSASGEMSFSGQDFAPRAKVFNVFPKGRFKLPAKT